MCFTISGDLMFYNFNTSSMKNLLFRNKYFVTLEKLSVDMSVYVTLPDKSKAIAFKIVKIIFSKVFFTIEDPNKFEVYCENE